MRNEMSVVALRRRLNEVTAAIPERSKDKFLDGVASREQKETAKIVAQTIRKISAGPKAGR